MNINLEVNCPYCKYINPVDVKVSKFNQRFVVECIKDEKYQLDGCGQLFVVDIDFKPHYKIMLIEGMKERL